MRALPRTARSILFHLAARHAPSCRRRHALREAAWVRTNSCHFDHCAASTVGVVLLLENAPLRAKYNNIKITFEENAFILLSKTRPAAISAERANLWARLLTLFYCRSPYRSKPPTLHPATRERNALSATKRKKSCEPPAVIASRGVRFRRRSRAERITQ